MRRRTKVKVVSIRKLVLWVYIIPTLVIALLFMIFFLWAVSPSYYPYVGLKKTARNQGHIQIRYNLSPYSNAHATLDQFASCKLMDGSIYSTEGSSTHYRYINCDGRVGYVDEANLRWTVN